MAKFPQKTPFVKNFVGPERRKKVATLRGSGPQANQADWGKVETLSRGGKFEFGKKAWGAKEKFTKSGGF
ncbi:hypothetical protein EBI_26801 [Enterocytozoon bieneusi H348]|nr:hypothetical protein EBI_26801 [Enterocytozoon bieneusi H348]|eukprot:XP_002651333.1 hypothetical protein EBI_26801 [Enterocytozoon bieneusi H348]